MTMSLLAGGTMRILHPGVLEHHCPGCGVIHSIDIHAQSKDGKVIGFDGDEFQPSFGEPIRHDTPNGTCEYLLRGGVLIFMSNCWHHMAGKTRPLGAFPR